MTTRISSVVLIGCLCTCVSAARAALYEFTLQGELTQALRWADVAVGDPFTIRYTADSSDEDPNAYLGRYSATDAVVVLPNTTITSRGTAVLRVLTLEYGPDQRVGFLGWDLNYQFAIDFTFPADTLTSDQLPLALPLASATTAEWQVSDSGPQILGHITSYASAAVPEPVAFSLVALLAFAGRRPGRRPGTAIRCVATSRFVRRT